jgi:hypothetical protein
VFFLETKILPREEDGGVFAECSSRLSGSSLFNVNCAKLLLEYGGDPNVTGVYFRGGGVEYCDIESCGKRYLVSYDRSNFLSLACGNNDLEFAKSLMEHGAVVNFAELPGGDVKQAIATFCARILRATHGISFHYLECGSPCSGDRYYLEYGDSKSESEFARFLIMREGRVLLNCFPKEMIKQIIEAE